MDRRSSRNWFFLTFIILITLHLKVFSIENFDVSLAFLLIPFWTYKTFNIKTAIFFKKEMILIFVILIIPFISVIYVNNWVEFSKTFFQFVISYFLVARILFKPLKINFEIFKKTIFKFQLFLLTVVVIQYVMVVILGQQNFYNLFGDQQLYYQLPVSLSNFRMKAFYLEPSYLGFIIINLYWIRFHLKPQNLFGSNFFITIILLFFCKSAFAYAAFGLIFLYEFYTNKNFHFGRILKGLSLFIIIILAFLSFNKLYSFLRLNEISGNSGEITSGYMRAVLPVEILNQMILIDGYIFGLPFGRLEEYIEQFMTGSYSEGSINNAFFSLIGYWGILAIIFYLFLVFYFFKSKNKLVKSFILLLLINLNNSGAFVTIQFVFIAFLLPLAAIQITKNNIQKIKI